MLKLWFLHTRPTWELGVWSIVQTWKLTEFLQVNGRWSVPSMLSRSVRWTHRRVQQRAKKTTDKENRRQIAERAFYDSSGSWEQTLLIRPHISLCQEESCLFLSPHNDIGIQQTKNLQDKGKTNLSFPVIWCVMCNVRFSWSSLFTLLTEDIFPCTSISLSVGDVSVTSRISINAASL